MKTKAKKLFFFDKVVLLLNCVAAVSILISYFSPFTDPQKIWFVAFFGLAYPPLLLSNVLCIVYYIFRAKMHFVISLLCILIGWPVLTHNISFHSSTPPGKKTNERFIRMMTYNAHSFTAINVYNDVPTKRKMFRMLEEQQPDIVCFQEFYRKHKGEFDTPDSLTKILPTKHYYYQPFDLHDADDYGLAIFSKYPIIKKGIIILSPGSNDNKSIFTDIVYKSDTIRIYCIHLQSIHFEPEDYAYLDSVSHHGEADIHSSRRIGGKLKLAFIKRSQQVKTIQQHAAKCPYPYIIAGDFNDTPTSYAVNQLAKGLKNTFVEKGRGLGRTYNGDFPNYQIDYILTSPRFDVMNYHIIEKKLSDHYPVQSDLVLK
jgi:endonuclease/exonuclease/phosphatase family metal-dependent hydrolase